MDGKELIRTILKLILRRMKAGKYYGWELGYNNLIDWSEEELKFHDVVQPTSCLDPRSGAGLNLELVRDGQGKGPIVMVVPTSSSREGYRHRLRLGGARADTRSDA